MTISPGAPLGSYEWHTFHAEVWVRDLQNGQSRPVLQAKFIQEGARLSPDGHWLANESQELGISEIFVQRFVVNSRRQEDATLPITVISG